MGCETFYSFSKCQKREHIFPTLILHDIGPVSIPFFFIKRKKKEREKEKKPDLLYILQTQFSESAIRRSFNIEVAKASLFVLL